MTLVSVGDLAQSFVLRNRSAALKQDLQTLSGEVVTGIAADQALHLSGDFVPVAALEASLAQLASYKSTTAEMGLFATAMQNAIASIDASASDLGQSLLSAPTSTSATRLDATGFDAQQRFEQAVSTLNTRFGDRSLFAGMATNGPALVGAGAMLTALDAEIAGALTAQDMVTAISAWFDAPTGFAASYLGAGALAPLQVAPGETAQIDVTALDPALVQTLKGLAIGAMLNRGALAGDLVGRSQLARAAAESLISSQTDRALLAARLGTTEAHIGAADVRNQAETTSLSIARLDLLSLDPYETASKLEERQSQLELLYAITSRMSRLSLVNYL